MCFDVKVKDNSEVKQKTKNKTKLKLQLLELTNYWTHISWKLEFGH